MLMIMSVVRMMYARFIRTIPSCCIAYCTLLLLSSLDYENIKFLAKKQRSDWKSWGSGWRDGRYFYLRRFAKIGTFSSVLPPQGLFQPIYTILLHGVRALFANYLKLNVQTGNRTQVSATTMQGTDHCTI
jgi:hypothetical protein